MTQLTTTAPARTVGYRWRLFLGVAIGVLAALAGVFWYLSWSEERDYQETLAETEQLDPGWRWADLEAARAAIPDDENAAVVSVAIHKAAGTVWLGQRLDENLGATPLNALFDAEVEAGLHKALEPHAEATALAVRLAELPRGRHPSHYDLKTANFTFDSLQWMRSTQHFLQLSVYHAAQQDDGARAALLCRSALNNARSVGDEGSLVALLVRIACVEIALAMMERTLALTTPPPAELQKLQELLQREIDEPRLAVAVRGERGLGADLLEAIRDGRQPRSSLSTANPGSWQSRLADWIPVTVSVSRAHHLRAMNELLTASRLPVEQQYDGIRDTVQRWRGSDAMVMTMLPAFDKTAHAQVRNHAKLRCALVAVAAERYRQQHHTWPATLDALVRSGQLAAVPLDPYDGQPLRYRALPDGVLIYSVGVDGVDNGGVLDRNNPLAVGSDIGFQLWNADARRRPAP